MAIRLKGKHELALSAKDVLEIRNRFFFRLESSRQIAEDYPVSEQLIKDAIHGRRGYASVKDDIPQLDKDNRSLKKTLSKSDKAQRIANKKRIDHDIVNGVLSPVAVESYRQWEENRRFERSKPKATKAKRIKEWRD